MNIFSADLIYDNERKCYEDFTSSIYEWIYWGCQSFKIYECKDYREDCLQTHNLIFEFDHKRQIKKIN